MTVIERYLKGCKRGEFTWGVDEAGEFGEANRVDVESTQLDGRVAKVTRNDVDSFTAEIDDLHNEPFYDCNEFTSRRSARSWCECMIRKDILGEVNKKELINEN